MFIAALFPISKIWKQPKCPSQMNNKDVGCREYYSAIKNETRPSAATWMDLEIIILWEANQRLMISLIYGIFLKK